MTQRIVFAAITTAIASLLAVPGTGRQRANAQEPAVREIEIIVRGRYTPDRITVREGERVRLRFIRQESSSCTREVVFSSLNLRRELPPHHPVVIDLPALTPGEHEFHCGMNMVRGTIVVEPAQ